MRSISIYEGPNFCLSFNEVEHWVKAEWIGDQTLETVIFNGRQIIKGLKSLTKYSCAKVLNDNRRMTGDCVGSFDWLNKEFIPNLYYAGCEHFAWVQSQDFHNQASIQDILMLDFRTIKTLIFDDIESAETWLREH